MKVSYIIAMAAALSVSTAAIAADDGKALFEKNNYCSGCHALTKKTVGPLQSEITAKYKGVKGAEATLEAKVRSGGKGSFGNVMAMPPTPATVSDASIKIMVKWLLSQK